MFHMEQVGRKISSARKAKNMTQMELADQLAISFQAVSNWERGISMPDISKLPELSEVLELSIDELLGKPSELINGMVTEGEEHYLKQHEVSIEELTEAAPILKPKQIDEVFQHARNRNTENQPDLSELAPLIPYLGTKLCDELFLECLEQEEKSLIRRLVPYVSHEKVDEAFLKLAGEGRIAGELVPFASRSIINQLAEEVYEQKGIGGLNALFPFIDKNILHQIAQKEYQKNGLRHFGRIAPFLEKDYLNQLAKEVLEREGFDGIGSVIPFLGREASERRN